MTCREENGGDEGFMTKQRPSDVTQYDARAVCDRLGTLYEVQCK
jgi:hypothetical protein